MYYVCYRYFKQLYVRNSSDFCTRKAQGNYYKNTLLDIKIWTTTVQLVIFRFIDDSFFRPHTQNAYNRLILGYPKESLVQTIIGHTV